MKFSADNPIKKLSWNRKRNLMVAGYGDGKVAVFALNITNEQGGNGLDTPQNLEAHRKTIAALSWSSSGELLAIGDSSGKISFWTTKDKEMKSILTNATVSAIPNSIRWSKTAKEAIIAYSDKTCACVSYDGDLKWSNEMRHEISIIEWAPNGKAVLAATSFGEVLILDSRGVEVGAVQLPCLANQRAEPKVVHMEWKTHTKYGLLIVFKSGAIQLMRNETDSQPITIDLDLDISAASWFQNGNSFVVAGTKPNGRCTTIFFNTLGQVIRELEVPGSQIMGLSISPSDNQLAILSESLLCIAQIIPSFIWAYSNNTLFISYSKNENDDYAALYYNKKTGFRKITSMKNVHGVTSHSGYFIITLAGGKDSSTLVVTDTVGVTLASTTIPFLPTSSASHKKLFAASSGKKIIRWSFIEEETPQIMDLPEEISAVCIQDKFIFVSCGNNIKSLDSMTLAEMNVYPVGLSCESISCSLDCSILSLIDSIGNLQFYSTSENKIVGPNRKEVWNMAWSSDTPNQFAALEKNRLYIYNDLEPEDPIVGLYHIAEFSNLELLSIDISNIMTDPMVSSNKNFHSYPTSSLRTLRQMLSTRPQVTLDEIFAYAKKQNHSKIWDELAENFMLEMNFPFAEKCFLETSNYKGLQFIKRIRTVKEGNIQRAQVLSFLGRYEEAESIYLSMDRMDLDVQMRLSIGDFSRVAEIIGNSNEDDEVQALVYNAVADQYAENAEWTEAAESYENAQNDEGLMKALYLARDIEGLKQLLDNLPQASPVLKQIGELFVSIGDVNSAVSAFTKAGDIPSAIAVCARLNHWKPALQLAGKGRNADIKAHMIKYATSLVNNSQIAAAVDFYKRSGLLIEAAKLLLQEGNTILEIGEDYVSAKMCYVFSGILFESHRKSIIDGSVNVLERLEGFLSEEDPSNTNLYQEIWRKAEGVHFYLLSHNFLGKKKYKNALLTAARVFDDYMDVIGETKAASLLAICGFKSRFFGQCSKAFTVLEHSDSLKEHQKSQFTELAIQIFTQNPPKDPASKEMCACSKCGHAFSPLLSQCPECGERVKICVMTGRPILEEKSWDCQHCKHSVIDENVEELIVCPLCHHKIEY